MIAFDHLLANVQPQLVVSWPRLGQVWMVSTKSGLVSAKFGQIPKGLASSFELRPISGWPRPTLVSLARVWPNLARFRRDLGDCGRAWLVLRHRLTRMRPGFGQIQAIRPDVACFRSFAGQLRPTLGDLGRDSSEVGRFWPGFSQQTWGIPAELGPIPASIDQSWAMSGRESL